MDRSDRKAKIISVVVAVAMITFVSILSGCIKERVYEEQSMPVVKKTEEEDYVSFEELYGSIPANLTDQRAWSQWKSEYKGKRIIGRVG